MQGLMFGYATDETEECMPLTILLAHKLNAKIKSLERNGILPWLKPDGKTQLASMVTMEYQEIEGVLEPLHMHTLVISVHYAPGVPLEQMRKELVKEVIPAKYLDANKSTTSCPVKHFWKEVL
ncbi:hypothetical protein JD844_009604, partial [Phrynosoma platyrhinos]